MRISTGLEALGLFLKDSLASLDLEQRVLEETCVLAWDEVVGEAIAEASQAESVREGRLYVTVKSSVWANELVFYKEEIIRRLNEKVGRQVIKDIAFRVGNVSKRSPLGKESGHSGSGLEGIELTKDELESIESAVQSIEGEAAASLRRLFITAKKMEKWKQAHGWTPCRKCGVLQNTAEGVCPPCKIDMQEK
jgi:predicted nucleic acid-binding Zn ribbon protein